jgi:hypothetical protein
MGRMPAEDQAVGVPDEVVHAVGLVTIAAGELELVLAVIAGMETGDNAFVVLAKPGEPLRAARRAVRAMSASYGEAVEPVVESAAALLAKRHAVVHAMLINEAPDRVAGDWRLLHYKTYERQPADVSTLGTLAAQLMQTRNRLVEVLTAKINNQAPGLDSRGAGNTSADRVTP